MEQQNGTVHALSLLGFVYRSIDPLDGDASAACVDHQPGNTPLAVEIEGDHVIGCLAEEPKL
jgi:hypothetical protein